MKNLISFLLVFSITLFSVVFFACDDTLYSVCCKVVNTEIIDGVEQLVVNYERSNSETYQCLMDNALEESPYDSTFCIE